MKRAAPSVWANPPGPPRAHEAQEMILRPDFFHPPGGLPRIEFSGSRRFRFASQHPSPWRENNVVHGVLHRAGPDWRMKPSVILLHGWNGELGYQFQFPLLAWRLGHQGLNVVMIELPYHGQRKPREPGATRNFLSPDLVRIAEATRQAISDVRTVIRWLAAEGSPFVALWGISLGAWLAGLTACADPGVKGAVLMTPVGRMDHAIEELPFSEPIRQNVGGHPLDLSPLNLVTHRPKADPGNILLVASRYDLFAPLETVEALGRAWGDPTIWRFDHGHISLLFSIPIMERTIRWLAGWARMR